VNFQLLQTEAITSTTSSISTLDPVFNVNLGTLGNSQSAGALWTITTQYTSKFTTFSTIKHNLVYATTITSPKSGLDTLGYLCDDIADANDSPDVVYYVSQELVAVPIVYVNSSQITTTEVSTSTFTISVGMITNNAKIYPK
jgi:hypothetical protein